MGRQSTESSSAAEVTTEEPPEQRGDDRMGVLVLDEQGDATTPNFEDIMSEEAALGQEGGGVGKRSPTDGRERCFGE